MGTRISAAINRMLDPLDRLARLVFPPHCLHCRRLEADGRWDVCRACLEMLDWDRRPTCPRCAATAGEFVADANGGCPRCRRVALAFTRTYRLGSYEGDRREAVLAAKKPAGEAMARSLGRLLARRLAAVPNRPQWNLIVPVPVYWLRRALGAFNHAGVLADEVGRGLHVPVRGRILRRVKDRPPQRLMSRTQRFENIRGAFDAAPRRRLREAHVLVVNDILTTGATASEAARCLKQAGAGQVNVAIVARTPG